MIDPTLGLTEAEEQALHRALFRVIDRVGFNAGPIEFCSACMVGMHGRSRDSIAGSVLHWTA